MKKRPHWFEFIRVRERRVIGSRQPPTYVVSFGPQNLCLQFDNEMRARMCADSIRDWLEIMMQTGGPEPSVKEGQ